jgi:flagellin
MGLRVNTNVASLTAQRNLSAVTSRLQGNYSRLSSGLRIATAADDAAGLGISERMRSQIRSYSVATRNAQDGISLVQTAEGALGEVSNILGRMRELAVQSSNGTLTSTDRETINAEFSQLVSEVDRIAGTASFNGINLLNGSTATASIQVGINAAATDTIDVALQDTTAATLGLAALDTTDIANSQAAITALDTAINSVSSSRGSLGASQNRLSSALANTQNIHENLSAAESRIRDVDVAFETADLTRNSIMQQAATSILAQANTQPQLALSLLG